ncbi:MAG: ParB/RepB/Spo0J family partition protein [Myxococcota bacterium]
MTEVQKIKLGLIEPAPQNRGGKTGDTEELAQSLRTVGQQVPIKVRPLKRGRFQVVFGHRRLKAASEIGWNEINAVVDELDDDAAKLAGLVENAIRKNPHPMDEAVAIEALSQAGATVPEVSERLGMAPAYIAARRRLLGLQPPQRKAFRANEISLQSALLLARVQGKRQGEFLKKFRDEAEDARVDVGVVLRYALPLLTRATFALDDDSLDAPPCTTCPNRSGNQTALFADGLDEEQLCTDSACFKAKHALLYKREKKRAKDEGHTVLTVKDCASIFDDWNGDVSPSSKYVSGKRELAFWYELHTNSKRTVGSWVKANKVALPQVLAKRPTDGAPVCLFLKSDFLRAWKRINPSADKASAKTPTSAAEKKKKAKAAQGRKIKKAVELAALEQLEKIGETDPDRLMAYEEDVARATLVALCGRLTSATGKRLLVGREDMQAQHAALKKAKGYAFESEVIANSAPDMKTEQVWYWLVRATVLSLFENSDGVPPAFGPLGKALGVDVEAIKRATTKAPTKKPKKSATKKPKKTTKKSATKKPKKTTKKSATKKPKKAPAKKRGPRKATKKAPPKKTKRPPKKATKKRKPRAK